jgi:tetratricopeptide (TPR) repeat protein
MAHSLRSSSFALVTTTVIVLGAAATPAFAQPMPPAMPSVTPKPKPYPDVPEAVIQELLGGHNCFALGVEELKHSLRKHPELPSAHVIVYQLLMQRNQPTAARFELEVAIQTAPDDPDPYIILGNIALKERRIAEATMDFDKAKRLLQKYTNKARKRAVEQQMMSGIAQLAEARGDWKEAEVRLRELLKLAPEDFAVYYRLAHSLFAQGKPRAVVAAYDTLFDAKASERYRTRQVLFWPEIVMATYYDEFEGPQSQNTEVWFRAATRVTDHDLPTRHVVFIWAWENGKIALAKEQAEAAVRIEAADNALPEKDRKYSRSSVGRMLRGLIALWEKDWRTAEKYFQTVVLEDPNGLVARNNLALALVEQDDPAKKQRALDYAKANFREKNSTSEALWTLGWVYFRRNEFEPAGFALDQAVTAANDDVTNADAATYLAHVLFQQDKKWQAKKTLDNVLKAGRPFCMRPEAEKLYEKVKDAKSPEETPAARTR